MSTTDTYRPLMTIAEAAERLRVSERTVRRLITAGVLPHLRVGAQIRLDAAEVESWLYGISEGRQ